MLHLLVESPSILGQAHLQGYSEPGIEPYTLAWLGGLLARAGILRSGVQVPTFFFFFFFQTALLLLLLLPLGALRALGKSLRPRVSDLVSRV